MNESIEFNSILFTSLLHLLQNDIAKTTPEEALEYLKEKTGCEEHRIDTNYQRENEIIDLLYRIPRHFLSLSPYKEEDREEYESVFEDVWKLKKEELKEWMREPVPILPTTSELSWLRDFLDAPESKFLLPPDLWKILDEKLKDTEKLVPEKFWKKRMARDNLSSAEREKLTKNLAEIQKALIEKTMLHYVHQAANGETFDRHAAPVRLEYDIVENSYSLVVWQETEDKDAGEPVERAVKMSVQRLPLVEAEKDKIPKDVPEKLRKFYRQQKRQVSIELRDLYNTMERAFLIFTGYEKTAYELKDAPDDFRFHMDISFFHFDRDELCDKLMSLGAGVRVVTNESVDDAKAGNAEKKGKENIKDASKEIRSILADRWRKTIARYETTE